MDLYWGLNLDEWKTLSIVAQGALMIFLVGTGIYQLMAIRKQAKLTATIQTFSQWSTESVLYECQRKLFEAKLSGDFEKNPIKYRQEVLQILNELDVTAIGIQNGIYDEKLLHTYLQWVVHYNAQRYLHGDMPKKLRIALYRYENFLALDRKWGDPGKTLPEDLKKHWESVLHS